MKLHEIIEPQLKTSNVKNFSFHPEYKDRSHSGWDDPGHLGAGIFYKGFKKKDDPHEIKKISKDPIEQDKEGFSIYADLLIKNKITGNNIHAPRIYNVHKVIDEQTGKLHYDFSVEKLISSNELKEEEIMPIFKQILPPIQYKELMKKYEDDNYISNYTASKITYTFGEKFLKPKIKAGQFDTNSKDLNELMELIRHIHSKYGIAIDLHHGNILYRRTSVGLQLVINDPLSH